MPGKRDDGRHAMGEHRRPQTHGSDQVCDQGPAGLPLGRRDSRTASAPPALHGPVFTGVWGGGPETARGMGLRRRARAAVATTAPQIYLASRNTGGVMWKKQRTVKKWSCIWQEEGLLRGQQQPPAPRPPP